MAEKEDIPNDGSQSPWNSLTLETSVPTVIRKDTGKINVLNGPGILRRLPRPEAETELLKESIGLLRGEEAPGRMTLSSWPILRTVRRTRMDQAHSAGSPRACGPNEDRGSSC
jgi:hypothetical protein